MAMRLLCPLVILLGLCGCLAGTTRNANEETTSDAGVPTFDLSNGVVVPMVGLGGASGVSYQHVKSAIEGGYRFVDTAQSHSWGYKEEEVGRAVQDAGKRFEDDARDYVFVQTKIHPQDLGYRSTQGAIHLSMERLQVSSLDSILIHKPRCWGDICSREPEGTWHDSWTALEEAVDRGLVRSIGICDVDGQILDDLLKKRIKPTIIQNWFDPFHQDRRLRERLLRHNEENPDNRILYQAYSTLGTQWHHHKGLTENPVINNELLQSIASKHGVGVPQVVIQWATRSGVMVLPASRSAPHQESNLDSFGFNLTKEEMAFIDALDGREPKPKAKDPDEVQITMENAHTGAIHVYWVPAGSTDEADHIPVGEMKGSGDTLSITSYHGHRFVHKDDGGRLLNSLTVNKALGPVQKHEIDDSGEEL